jgi:diguanylate cyclase (GGDEF)-like protein
LTVNGSYIIFFEKGITGVGSMVIRSESEHARLSDKDVEVLISGTRNLFVQKRRNQLLKKFREKAYIMLLNRFVSLKFTPEVAKQVFISTMKGRRKFQNLLGREVDFKVALLDFFLYEGKELVQDPIIIEQKIFRDLQKRALVDELTGLKNYRYYNDRILEEIARAKRTDIPFSLIILDIDDFKSYNDLKGHLEGNNILRILAGVINETLRLSDIAVRYGGDEFVLILPNTSRKGADLVGSRIRDKLRRTRTGKAITISGGIATFLEDTKRNEKKLFELADKAMYMAKYRGKDQILHCT